MSEQAIGITAVETKTLESELWPLLREFHDWLRTHVPHEYDVDEGLATDRRSFVIQSAFWAWLARHDEEPYGCVLLYGMTDDLAELGRLWVKPSHREHGIGRRLTRTVIDEARTRGYETLGLTTPPWSEAAHELYESLGFEHVAPYSETRLPKKYHDDAIFMKLELTEAESNSGV